MAKKKQKKQALNKVFGIWKGRKLNLKKIRKEAWERIDKKALRRAIKNICKTKKK